MIARPAFRFAPSPNGRLHLGHAFSALTTSRLAERAGGRFILRIEDIDIGRTREEYVDGIFEDLAWLGLRWEEPVLRQSHRFESYVEVVAQLQGSGLLYPCSATRTEIAAALSPSAGTDPDGAPLYRPVCNYGRAPALLPPCAADGRAHALRLNMDAALVKARELGCGTGMTYRAWDAQSGDWEVAADPKRWGDAVIARKDVPTSYHLAVVVDDAYQGITHVTRGQDLEAATDLHVLLQALLGFPQPVYHHHSLITDLTGRKLSKSAKDTSLASLRASGITAEEVRRHLGFV